jgi:diguanylate cyclase (GGDEF)-like protein
MRAGRRDNFAYKITLMTVLASGMAVVTLMTAFLAFDCVSSRSQLQIRLATLADILGQNSTAALDFEDRPAALEVLHALRAETPIVSACLYDRSGHLFAEYHRGAKSANCPATLEGLPVAGRDYCAVIRRVERHGEFDGTLYLLSDMHKLQKRGRHLLQVTGVLFLLAVVVGGVSGSLLQRRISKPIYELARAMHEVTEQNNFSARVSVSGKDEIAQLGTGFNRMLSELQNREGEKRKVEEQLQHQALNDELTGLPNRRLLRDRLTHSLEVARREQKRVALLYIDLDGFKLVNDSLGHTVGDILLCQVADRLRLRIRRSDTLARLGGDEFATLLINLHAKEQAGHVAQKLLQALTHPFQIEEHEITISACLGVSLFPDNGASATDLLQQADSAMYAAKRAGKNRMTYFTEDLGATVRERLNLENRLRAALAHGEIRVHYQPEFEVGSHRLVRFEALARWTDPTLGTIPPGKFIPSQRKAA